MAAETEKLQKVLARTGFGSRRQLERWISVGRITVNGVVAKLGDRVSVDDRICVDGKAINNSAKATPGTRIILYHKPPGQICTRRDPEGRETVFDHLPSLKKGRWISVGRLDINTSGLLLFTNDGGLANRLMHPSSHLEREYAVRILGNVDAMMLQRLKQGVQLEDGLANFEEIADGGGEGANHWYRVSVKEGRNRIVRRLWESQGVTVSRLMRIRFGPIILPKSLKQGQWVDLLPRLSKALTEVK